MPSVRLSTVVAGILLAASAPACQAAEASEFLCLKDLNAALEGLSVACYSEAGCAYVEQHKGDPLPDYDQESVAYALGREKIEGIITASDPIMKKIKGFGYACRKLD